MVIIEGDNWQSEVLGSDVPVLVDFWAEWCGPCKAIAPTLDQVADECAGKLKVAKVDIEANQNLASQFGIRSIPTLLVLKGGTVQEQMMGAVSKAVLMDKLAPFIS